MSKFDERANGRACFLLPAVTVVLALSCTETWRVDLPICERTYLFELDAERYASEMDLTNPEDPILPDLGDAIFWTENAEPLKVEMICGLQGAADGATIDGKPSVGYLADGSIWYEDRPLEFTLFGDPGFAQTYSSVCRRDNPIAKRRGRVWARYEHPDLGIVFCDVPSVSENGLD
jgi:hypothetical protein